MLMLFRPAALAASHPQDQPGYHYRCPGYTMKCYRQGVDRDHPGVDNPVSAASSGQEHRNTTAQYLLRHSLPLLTAHRAPVNGPATSLVENDVPGCVAYAEHRYNVLSPESALAAQSASLAYSPAWSNSRE